MKKTETSQYIHVSSAKGMQELASSLAQEVLLEPHRETARVFALQGELGAGKTTFV